MAFDGSESQLILAALEGTFDGKEYLHPMPGAPEGRHLRATVVNRQGCRGKILTQHYLQRKGETVEMEGHGVFSAHPDTQEYSCHWWDSRTGLPVLFRGGLDGEKLVLEAPAAEGTLRAQWWLTDEGYSYELFAVMANGMAHPLLDGTYQRLS